MIVTFSVPFVTPKGRPRFRGHAFTPNRTKDAEKAVRDAYKGACVRMFGHVATAPEGVPVTVTVAARKAAPRSRPKYIPKSVWDFGRWAFTSTPDLDNLMKLVCDALNPIKHKDKATGRQVVDEYVAWHDDAQITELHGFKLDKLRGTQETTYVLVKWEE